MKGVLLLKHIVLSVFVLGLVVACKDSHADSESVPPYDNDAEVFTAGNFFLESYYEAGLRHWEEDRPDSALVFFSEILKYPYYVQDTQTAKDWVDVATSCGVLAFQMNRNYQALNLFMDAYSMACKFGLKDPAPLINASILYAHEWNFEKAYALCTREEGLPALEKDRDFVASANLLVSLLTCAMGMNDKEKVDTCLKKLYLPVYDTIGMAMFGRYRAESWLAAQGGKYDSALNFVRQALAHATAFSDTSALYAAVYKDIGNLYLQKGNYDSALWYYNRSLPYCYQRNDLASLQNIYRQKINILDKLRRQKEYKEAVEFYTEISQAIEEENRSAQQQNIDYIIHQREQDREIAELYYDQLYKSRIIAKQKILILALSAVFCLLLSLFILLYINKKRKAKTNLILYEKTQKLLLLEQNQNKILLAENTDLPEVLPVTEGETPHRMDESQAIQLQREIERLLEEECYTKEDFNLNQFAKMLGSNTSYVSRIVNERFHKSFSALINEYRVRKSCLLMNDPVNDSYTLEYIGKLAGFGNRITFTKQFNKFVGMNPSDYWKLAKEKADKEDS